MIPTRHLTLALGLAAILASPALAQRPGGPGQGGPGRFGGQGMGMGMQGSLLQLLMAPPVQEELALSDEQVEKLRPIGDRIREEMMGRLRDSGDLAPEERRERFEQIAREVNETSREEVKEILKAEQLERVEQIQLQQQGAQAFASPRVVEELKLDDEQKSKIDAILESYRTESRSIMESARDAEGRGEAMERFGELRRGTMDKAMGVLSEEQKSTWKELTGEPFELGPGGFGGRGGPGGRGPGGRPGDGPDGQGGRPGGRRPGQN